MVLKVIKGDEIKELFFEEKIRLGKLLKDNGVSVPMPCSGSGRCGKCKAIITGEVAPPTEAEMKLLSKEELQNGVRLICECVILGDAEVILPNSAGTNVQIEGQSIKTEISKENKGIGLAVDIGTTTVAAYLLDMVTGDIIASAGVDNPQNEFGADVISRIEHALAGEGDKLKSRILSAIDNLAHRLLKESKRNEPISEGVLVGNTAMLYFLTGETPATIASAPFIPSRYFGETVTAGKLGLKSLNDSTNIYLARSISAFVGADITAAIYSTALHKKENTAILIDIGTNGEMALKAGDKIYCCSTAAGPAFEGVGISCGCQAVGGAINYVYEKDGVVAYKTIGDAPAVGLCGTGLIDAASVLLQLGLIDETGRIDEDRAKELSMLKKGEDYIGIVIAEKAVLTQKDIRQLQLAKAALRAGIKALLHSAGLFEESLDECIIAGGFGSYIDIKSACNIGLLPKCIENKASAVGNAAGAGAGVFLLSKNARAVSETLTKEAISLSLSTDPFFMESYIDSMCFE